MPLVCNEGDSEKGLDTNQERGKEVKRDRVSRWRDTEGETETHTRC